MTIRVATALFAVCAVVGCLFMAGCGETENQDVIATVNQPLTSEVVEVVIDGVTVKGVVGCSGTDVWCASFEYTYDWACTSRQQAMAACIAAGVCTNFPSPGCNTFGGGTCDYGTVTTAYCLDPNTAYCYCTCDNGI